MHAVQYNYANIFGNQQKFGDARKKTKCYTASIIKKKLRPCTADEQLSASEHERKKKATQCQSTKKKIQFESLRCAATANEQKQERKKLA